MQITEYIEAQRQKVRFAARTNSVLLVLTALAIEFLPLPPEIDRRTRILVFAIAAVLAAIVGQLRARRALQCPRCQRSLLRPLLTVRGPVDRCPLCSADFHEAMPGRV